MKQSPKFSIIVPSYNSEKFIKDTLDSIFVQKYSNLEVIVQDGGSTDGTVGILKKYANKYSKQFKYESKKDKGQADAINKALKKVKGEIVAYINSDDVYETGAFQQVALAYYNNPQALWFAGQGKVINRDGEEISRFVTLYKNFFLRLNKFFGLLTFNYLMQPSVFLTRKSLKKIDKFTSLGKMVMEYESWLNLAKLKMPVVIREDLSSFRMSEGNFSSTQTINILTRDEEIVRKFTNNPLILFFHKLNNLGRYFMLQSMR